MPRASKPGGWRLLAWRRTITVGTLLLTLGAVLVGIRLWPKPALSSVASSSVAVYDANGSLLRLSLAQDDRYRLWVPLERISPDLAEAFLLHEDQYFYYHPGANPFALVRGAWRTYSGSGPRQGGSTITMQLARLVYGLNTRDVGGKLRQIARACELELLYSKHDILEAYLNLVPYGSNIEGTAAASLIHFDKKTTQLSLPEVMTLAVIPQAPSRRGLDHSQTAGLAAARARLFERWCEVHPAAREQAALMRLPLNLSTAATLPFSAPHAVDMLLAQNSRNADGEIRSTVDLPLQRTVERQLRQYAVREARVGINNASAMLVDYRTMEVKAVVGSADFFNSGIDGQVNGTLAKRSPGSALKPFIYALAIDQGLIHPLSVLKDAPAAFGPFSPENFDGQFVGPIAAKDALIRSRNIPAVALTARLSSPTFYDFLKSAGVSRMASENHYGLALALGGGEVTMEELASLYAMLANRGELRPLRYRQDDAGKDVPGVRLLSEEASFITLDMLKENQRPDTAYSGTKVNVPVYWKTGTSWGFRDAWTAGIFGPYVLVVWVGNFDGESNPALVGVQTAAPLFFQIVDAIAAQSRGGNALAAPVFRVPPGLQRVEVCAASGDLPNAYCPMRERTWFIPGKSPIKVSTLHRPVTIDTRTGRQACPPYDPAFVKVEIYEYWPSDLMRLFRQAGMPRRAPPPNECGVEIVPGTAPMITSPTRGSTYTLREKVVGPEVIPLQATADAGVHALFWFVNDAYVGTAKPGNAVAWQPSRTGRFLLRVVDEQGRSDARDLHVVFAN
jgi:penicillin-binding protein 1C